MQKKKGNRSKAPGTAQKQVATGKKRIVQLICSICLFVAVFAGQELKITEEYQSGKILLQAIRSNTDFKAMFQKTGEIFAENLSELRQFEKLAIGVWKPEELPLGENEQQEDVPVVDETINNEEESEPLQQEEIVTNETNEVLQGNLDTEEVEDVQDVQVQEDTTAPPEISPYTGPALPANASMEYFELGLAETVTPVLGRMTSPYGYRDDPMASGEDEFHVGIDLSAEIGTPVLSFAAGTVDFIGESSGYGLYIQINHGNGITTFYCHCSQLCVQKGMQVSAGQMIAKTGDTGNTTGPHLHMEMRRNGILLNPEYYIEVLPM